MRRRNFQAAKAVVLLIAVMGLLSIFDAIRERGQVTLSQSHGNDLTNKQTKARSVRTPIRHINYRKRNYTLMFENFKSEIPKDVLSFQEQHNAVLETKPLDAMNLKEIKRHLFRSKRCPAYERWRYSPNRDQFERDATTARGSFENLIISQQVSRVVHFVGDSSKTWQFTFLQYLAVLSAIRFIQPHSVYIHLAQEPDVDDSRYLEWWDDVLDSIPHLTLVKLDHGVPTSAEKILREYGGFVVPWDVLIFEELDAPLEERSNDGYSPVGISYMAEATFKIRHVSSSVDGIFKYDRKFLHENAWFRQVETNQTHPADFFTGDDPLSRNVRALMYASKSRIVAKSDPTTKIPLLCHYILIGNNYLKLEAFISMLSCLEIIGADVYVHGNSEPQCKKWKTLVNLYGERVRFINSDYPVTAYGNAARTPTAASDVWRFEILIRYGGIYVDWDVIWLKPLAPELLTYEAVTSRDMYIPSGLPDNLNNGVLLAKKDAEFLHRCQESLRYYRTGCFVPQLCQTNVDWRFDAVLRLYNALFATYKVYECYPWTVLIEPHLQIMCFYGTCLPMWPRNSSEPIDWSDTYTQHFSDDPVEYSNSSLLASELERLENGDSVSFVVSNAAKVFKKARFSITQLRALG